MSLRLTVIAAVLAAIIAVPAGARADDHRDQDIARQAVQRGEIKPLEDILRAVRGKLPGEIAGVKIERKGGRLFYEFRVVGAQGRLFEVYVDAATGDIARTEEK